MNRYQRQQVLPEIGEQGQQALANAKVLVIGVGGLGSPAAMYLAGAGVGQLGLIDPDTVAISNLHRQVLYRTDQAYSPKVDCARDNLLALNPEIEITSYQQALNIDNALELIAAYDVVIDGSDNFATRYLVNDACVILGKPNIHASVLRFAGQLSVFCQAEGPCYRCLFPEPAKSGIPNCADAGVLGSLPGILGLMQAQEALKIILNIGESLQGRLLSYDALSNRWQEYQIHKNPNCPLCQSTQPELRPQDYVRSCDMISNITAKELEQLRLRGGITILDVREDDEYQCCHIEGALHIPLREVSAEHPKLKHLDDKPLYIYCHHGMRSLHACQVLANGGFSDLYNLNGGIDAWAVEVEPEMVRY